MLDEGHFIRNAGTHQSRAAAEIPARARWAVTGTPIQNAMKDLFGLLAFLHVSPLCERPVFNAALDRPVAGGDAAGLLRLKVLMSHVALRRLKTTKVRCGVVWCAEFWFCFFRDVVWMRPTPRKRWVGGQPENKYRAQKKSTSALQLGTLR